LLRAANPNTNWKQAAKSGKSTRNAITVTVQRVVGCCAWILRGSVCDVTSFIL